MRSLSRPARRALAACRSILFACAALAAACVPARAQSVAETNLVASLVNSADAYLKEDKILLALDALVQAEKFKVSGDLVNETLARVLKRRKELCDARLQKVRMYLNDNDAKKAIASLKEILDFWPDNEEVLKKLESLGVKVKHLNLQSQRYQKEDYSLLDDLKRQIKSVDDALKELADLEKRRKIKEALAAAEEFYEKLERNPAIEIKLNLYRAAWAALAQYAKVKEERERENLRGAADAARSALELDPVMKHGFLGLESDELAVRLLFGAEAAIGVGEGSLAVALYGRLEELGRLGMAAYVDGLSARRDGRHGDALKALSSARLLASPAEQKFMALARLTALSFLAHYKSLLLAMAFQVAIFGLVAFRTFAFADLALDHEFSRFLFFAEREIGYYISRCGALVANGKWKKAERLARYILKRNPGVPQAHLWTGICRYRLGDKRSAMRIIGDFLKDAPRHPEANYYMGLLKDDHNQPRDALVHLELARGISGAARKFKLEQITRKDDLYIGIFQEYKTAAAEMLGIRF